MTAAHFINQFDERIERKTFVVPVQFRERELEILRMFAKGKTYKEIFVQLGLSKTRMWEIMRGLRRRVGVETTTELVVWAIRNKVIE
jgi:DNA-binding CsgD family transcriptional regulator